MKKDVNDFIGKKFGLLSVVSDAGLNGSCRHLNCECECGRLCTATAISLERGRVKDCGCILVKFSSDGDSSRKSPLKRLHRIWMGIKYRTGNKSQNAKLAKWYFNKGIKICQEWEESYLSFKSWALSNGYQKELTIDRIDTDGNYCPENCRWVSMKVQAVNRSNTILLTYKERTLTVIEWSKLLKIGASTIYGRHSKGLPIYEVLSTTPLT